MQGTKLENAFSNRVYAQKSVDGLFDGLFDAAGKKDRQRRRALTVFWGVDGQKTVNGLGR